MSDRPGLDDSNPQLEGVAGLRLQPEDHNHSNELAELAARFASRANGGLSPELSAELALEILLNEIAEQACAATGATGAAIALERDGEMVCRATSGNTAPDLGSRVDLLSGLSGKCVQTRQTQRCEDVLADPQADVAASRRLGVRSVMVMPLLQGDKLIGFFELFSSLPAAFGANDEDILYGFAQRALHNIDRSKQPMDAQPETATVAEPVSAKQTTDDEGEPVEVVEAADAVVAPVRPAQSSAMITWALVAGIVLTAMLLGMVLGRHVIARRALAQAKGVSRAIEHSAPVQESGSPSAVSAAESSTGVSPIPNQVAPRVSLPPGSLAVYDNGKQIFHVAPEETIRRADSAGRVESASSVNRETVSGISPGANLLYHVDPAYPDAARRKKVQGAVVLDVYIAKNGSVQGVQFVSGPPELSDTSITAVKQWRFKPVMVSGHPAEMQTRVTLNFVLPE